MMLILLLAVLSKPVIGVAQDAPPAGIAEIELERSRLCVPVSVSYTHLRAHETDS
mgnify:CR=1 FL=1